MNSRTCEECYYNGECFNNGACAHFMPMDEELSDERISEIVEDGRREYRTAWNEYIYFFNTSD